MVAPITKEAGIPDWGGRLVLQIQKQLNGQKNAKLLDALASTTSYANDAAAAAAGVAVGSLYRNGSVVQIRVT